MLSTIFINPELVEIRKLYEIADQSNANYKSLIGKLATATATDKIIIKAYTAAGVMISANFEFNPFTKLKYFNEGKVILESAITEHKLNTELRYIRFTIQERCPRILGYSGQINADKKFLIQQVSETNSSIDEDLSDRIILYLLKSESLSIQEKSSVKKINKKSQ